MFSHAGGTFACIWMEGRRAGGGGGGGGETVQGVFNIRCGAPYSSIPTTG